MLFTRKKFDITPNRIIHNTQFSDYYIASFLSFLLVSICLEYSKTNSNIFFLAKFQKEVKKEEENLIDKWTSINSTWFPSDLWRAYMRTKLIKLNVLTNYWKWCNLIIAFFFHFDRIFIWTKNICLIFLRSANWQHSQNIKIEKLIS